MQQLMVRINRDRNYGDRNSNHSRAWWIKITTRKPKCIYYFGSFNSHHEAKDRCFDYIEDLAAEKAQGITVEFVYSEQPEQLTVFED